MRKLILTAATTLLVALMAAPVLAKILPETLDVVNTRDGLRITVTMQDMSDVPPSEIRDELAGAVKIYPADEPYFADMSGIDWDAGPSYFFPLFRVGDSDTYEVLASVGRGEWVVVVGYGVVGGPTPVHVTVGGIVWWPWLTGVALLAGASLWAYRGSTRREETPPVDSPSSYSASQ